MCFHCLRGQRQCLSLRSTGGIPRRGGRPGVGSRGARLCIALPAGASGRGSSTIRQHAAPSTQQSAGKQREKRHIRVGRGRLEFVGQGVAWLWRSPVPECCRLQSGPSSAAEIDCMLCIALRATCRCQRDGVDRQCTTGSGGTVTTDTSTLPHTQVGHEMAK